MQSVEPKYYTIAEVAALICRHPSTVYKMVSRGDIETVEVFGKALVPREQIDAALRPEDQAPKPTRRGKRGYRQWV